LRNKYQALWIKLLEDEVKNYTPLRNTKLVAFNENVDELLLNIHKKCLYLEDKKQRKPHCADLLNNGSVN
jgi:hypothetical protein